MLLTITTTHEPATDLGYLLHKNPARVQSFPLSFGQAHIFYPERSSTRCTMALLLDVDPIALVRGPQGHSSGGAPTLDHYVNDRPYVLSSFLSVAIARVLGTALAGRCNERPALVQTAIPLQAHLAVLPCWAGEELIHRLFGPLGYQISIQAAPLDPQFPDWGQSPYYAVTLEATCRLSELLTHLYVLVPVLDDQKHYWVGDAEVETLLRHGGDWLAAHPERELIVKRALRHQRSLTSAALTRLLDEDQPDPDATEARHDQEEAGVERPIALREQRLAAVVAALKASGAKRVLDLGCGEGHLLQRLIPDPSFETITGMDVSARVLAQAEARLHLDRLPTHRREQITLLHGSLTYRDQRLTGYDAAAVVEVIEHLDETRLEAFARTLFGVARPHTIVVTTPNAEYNTLFERLPAGHFRHQDHRFEWTRAQFQAWAEAIGQRFGYQARFLPIGPEDPDQGAPTQMAIFTKADPL